MIQDMSQLAEFLHAQGVIWIVEIPVMGFSLPGRASGNKKAAEAASMKGIILLLLFKMKNLPMADDSETRLLSRQGSVKEIILTDYCAMHKTSSKYLNMRSSATTAFVVHAHKQTISTEKSTCLLLLLVK